jgi:hypothetical protein
MVEVPLPFAVVQILFQAQKRKPVPWRVNVPWVKPGKAQRKPIFSGLPRKQTTARY